MVGRLLDFEFALDGIFVWFLRCAVFHVNFGIALPRCNATNNEILPVYVPVCAIALLHYLLRYRNRLLAFNVNDNNFRTLGLTTVLVANVMVRGIPRIIAQNGRSQLNIISWLGVGYRYYRVRVCFVLTRRCWQRITVTVTVAIAIAITGAVTGAITITITGAGVRLCIWCLYY